MKYLSSLSKVNDNGSNGLSSRFRFHTQVREGREGLPTNVRMRIQRKVGSIHQSGREPNQEV